MIVTFVSQCEKNALKKTRRILDAFANRIGDNVWQTAITEQGLKTVYDLLKASASRSTAVSCHRITSRKLTKVVWIVGNKRKFNEMGVVPVNRTRKNILHNEWEKGWQCLNDISLYSGIAGLFHDVGKANNLFQKKLNPQIKTKNFEPFRHEWVSLRIFEAFIKSSGYKQKSSHNVTDKQWLTKLASLTDNNINVTIHDEVIQHLITDNDNQPFINPFNNLPPIAKLIAWLIISHHRLPQFNGNKDFQPQIENVDSWLDNSFDYNWNSLNHKNSRITDDDIKENWLFDAQLPLISFTWRKKAKELATRVLRSQSTLTKDFTQRPFISHMSRLCVMLADHHYSSQEPTKKWQDNTYKTYANTDKNNVFKQQVDEHNVGVAHHAYLLSKKIPTIRQDLVTLDDNARVLQNGLLKNDASKQNIIDFGWQDKAYVLAKNLQKKSSNQGFFGICMASTGKGKTLANARIMYGLSDRENGCRFSIALGLRSLTLQTSKSLQSLLKVDEIDVATVIGSQAILNLQKEKASFEEEVLHACAQIGSESLDTGDEDYEVDCDLEVYEGFLENYFSGQPKAQKILKAPVLVSTIDHLMPATEGVRGGRQIVPMLRLLTSDLVLDEPDEFNEKDLPALTRLVHWAGMLGSKVLLSTASMPPYFAYALFDAYHAGRRDYHQDTTAEPMPAVICAWFDEFKQEHAEISDINEFIPKHNSFATKRIRNLTKNALPLRKAKIVDLPQSITQVTLYDELAKLIQTNSVELHKNHHQKNTKSINLSVGLVRFANINPLVTIAKKLYGLNPPKDTVIHYCVYHSQYPLAQRAHIEKILDTVLARHDSESIWQNEFIQSHIQKSTVKNHIFIVLATSVAEVGRDHDYDWAIAEPSSMRSLIQLAGRIQRHRKQIPKCENLYILQKNIKAIQGKEVCFTQPGFETKLRKLQSKDSYDILRECEYKKVTSIPSLEVKKEVETKLIDMEHLAYRQTLFGDKDVYKINAKNWWRYEMDWNAELQRLTRFRKSTADKGYCYYLSEDGYDCYWEEKNERISPKKYIQTDDIKDIEINIADGNSSWGYAELEKIYDDLVRKIDKPLAYVSRVYGEVRLADYDYNNWLYHPALGVHRLT